MEQFFQLEKENLLSILTNMFQVNTMSSYIHIADQLQSFKNHYSDDIQQGVDRMLGKITSIKDDLTLTAQQAT